MPSLLPRRFLFVAGLVILGIGTAILLRSTGTLPPLLRSSTLTAAVSIQSLTPASGPTGTVITVQGSGFSPDGNNISIGTFSEVVRGLSSDGEVLRFQFPATLCVPGKVCTQSTVLPGRYDIAVTTSDGVKSRGRRFDVSRIPRNPGTAYFEFKVIDLPARLVVALTNREDVQHARDLLAGRTTDRPHVMGTIVKQSISYAPPWSYHLTFKEFFDYAVELCDGTIQYTEDHLDEVGGSLYPDFVFCPWGSRLTAEI